MRPEGHATEIGMNPLLSYLPVQQKEQGNDRDVYHRSTT